MLTKARRSMCAHADPCMKNRYVEVHADTGIRMRARTRRTELVGSVGPGGGAALHSGRGRLEGRVNL